MTEPTIDGLLKTAESHALNGDWQSTIESMKQVLKLDPYHSGANRTIGTLMLETGDPSGAIPFLRRCLADEPGNEEASAALARAFAQSGQLKEAEKTLLGLLDENPENRTALNLLAQTLILQDDRVTEAVQILAALVQSDSTDPEALYLMGKVYESAGDMDSASDMFQQILRHHPGDERASAALAELRQAPENIAPSNGGAAHPGILFLGPPVPSTQDRLGLPAKALSEDGYPVQISTSWNKDDPQICDVVVISQPHASMDFLAAVLHYKSIMKRVYVDLNIHYSSLPEDHPLFRVAGPGNENILETLAQIIDMADGLLVSSKALGEAYQIPGREIHIFPPVWDPDNPLWNRPPDKRENIHLGLVGSQVQKCDGAIIKPALEALFTKHENLVLVVLENFALLDLFDGISDDHKLFLPASRYDDYPYQLSHIDILLVPGEDTPFNRTHSDRPLMEAGIRRIPWVASVLPSFVEWKDGGILIENENDWEHAISSFIQDSEKRLTLSNKGRKKSENRNILNEKKTWKNLIA